MRNLGVGVREAEMGSSCFAPKKSVRNFYTSKMDILQLADYMR